MSQPVGNFSCHDLLETQVKIERIWADSKANKLPFYANVVPLVEIINRQTAKIAPVEDGAKKRTVKIQWLEDCAEDSPVDPDVPSNDDRCDVGGTQIESNCKDYTITQFAKRKWTISEKQFEESSLSKEEVLAFQTLMRLKQADEEIAQRVLIQIAGWAGINQFSASSIGDVVGNDTYINPNFWDPNLMGYFYQTQQMNRFLAPYLLSGLNLSAVAWQINKEQPNAQDGQAAVNKMATMPLINDLFSYESNLSGTTMMIDSGAISFASRNRYSDTPIEYGNGADITLYSQPSKNIPGLRYDIGYKTRCVGDDIFHDFGATAHFDIFENPLGCNENITGILNFICGIAP